ncbi:MAG: nucleotidyltransferase family protein [Pelosinus sp.]|nr:nucleotidyltransferase family protein [Pelosinus sp.]
MPCGYSKLGLALTPEWRLALCCSQMTIQIEDEQEISSLIEGNLDWQYFLDLIRKHRLYPLIYWRFKSLSLPDIPAEVIDQLRYEDRKNKFRTLQMTEETQKIVVLMDKQGLKPIIIKGIPLTKLLYGDITHRTSNDIDILVRPQDQDKARKTLESMGYELQPSVCTVQDRLPTWMEHTQSLFYFNPVKRIGIDLTLRLGAHGAVIPWENIEECVGKINLAGQFIRILTKEVLFLHLVLHGAGHAWFRMKWLLDIDRAIRKGDLSWEAVYKLAEQLNVSHVVNQSLLLTREFYGTPILPELDRRLASDKLGKILAKQVIVLVQKIDFNPVTLGLIPPSRMFYLYKKYKTCMLKSWTRKIIYIFFESMNITLGLCMEFICKMGKNFAH